MKSPIKYVILVLCLLWQVQSKSQTGHFYSSGRLSSSLITCICQDRYGFIWVGTEYGLNKFDGYRFTTYFHSRNDSTTINDNEISTLFVDRDGRLWVGCSRGLVSYDYEHNNFRRYTFPDGLTPRVNSLTDDSRHRLLIGTAGYGLYSISSPNRHIDYESQFNRRQSDHFYSRIHIDRQGNLWRSDHLTTFTKFTVKNGQPTTFRDYLSTCGQPMRYIEHGQQLLIVCMYGILSYDYHTGEMKDAKLDLSQIDRNISMEDATIDKNAQRLLLLVNQILDERKIDKQQMKLSCQETDLTAFCYGIYKLYEYNALQEHIHYTFIHPENNIKVWIDRTQFDKVVSNLLSNAFKYTKDEVTLRLSLTSKSAVIEVIDNGNGFENDKTDRFFERFYQGKNSKDIHVDGTGIGLNLCRALTEMLGGKITAQNRKDGTVTTGAVLTVSLPLGKDHLKTEEIEDTPAQHAAPSHHATKKQANSNLHILVVDDDIEIGNYIKSELGSWYKFSYAPNGREALKLLLTQPFDLVVSDVMMPEMDGITLLRSIKSNTNISDIPVILLTSKSEVQYRLEGLKRGADAFLAKPFVMEELHVTIDKLVDNVRRLRGKFSGAQEQEDKVEEVKVKGNNDVLMEKIMKCVNENLSNPDFDMEMMTHEVGISRAQLHRKMKEMTGISTSEFVRNLRLEQAARLIREKKINITQVAYSVGFNNQAHFSTVFKKHFGMTPTEYAGGS